MCSAAVLDYPGLQVHFLYGRLDCSSAVSMGLLYANAITSGKAIEFVPNTPHFVAGTPVGREVIRRAIDLGTLGTVSVDRVGPAAGRGVIRSPVPRSLRCHGRSTAATSCRRLAGLLLLAAPRVAGAQSTFYVDGSNPAATDYGPGTEAVPYQTIYAAVRKRGCCGDT